jgi:phage terminase large subunit-like protein
LTDLEDQFCTYDGSGDSPDRLDAMVCALSDLMFAAQRPVLLFG